MKENLNKKSGDKDEKNKPAKTPQEEDNTIYTEYQDTKEKEEEAEEKKKKKK